jgi:hypothetical protein
VINDNWFAFNEPRRAVACDDEISEVEVEVIWLRELSLPDRYPSVRAVLEDVFTTVSASTKPTPIPHRRPATHNSAMAG